MDSFFFFQHVFVFRGKKTKCGKKITLLAEAWKPIFCLEQCVWEENKQHLSLINLSEEHCWKKIILLASIWIKALCCGKLPKPSKPPKCRRTQTYFLVSGNIIVRKKSPFRTQMLEILTQWVAMDSCQSRRLSLV